MTQRFRKHVQPLSELHKRGSQFAGCLGVGDGRVYGGVFGVAPEHCLLRLGEIVPACIHGHDCSCSPPAVIVARDGSGVKARTLPIRRFALAAGGWPGPLGGAAVPSFPEVAGDYAVYAAGPGCVDRVMP